MAGFLITVLQVCCWGGDRALLCSVRFTGEGGTLVVEGVGTVSGSPALAALGLGLKTRGGQIGEIISGDD